MQTVKLSCVLLAIFATGLLDIVRSQRFKVCPTLKLDYGRVTYRSRGRIAKFRCFPNYQLIGEKVALCTNGKWDEYSTRCVKSSCGKIAPPLNGQVFPQANGAVISFMCNAGYDLRGPDKAYCNGRRWDTGGLPSCLKSGHRPAKNCSFETVDLCGWTADLNHDFDWTRQNYGTPSGHVGTGPSYDHTLGPDKDGFYMYIESSSKIENDTARLLSPIYDPTAGDICFEFYYHMYGSGIGTLNVYLKQSQEDWNFGNKTPLFTRTGNQGDAWRRGFFKQGPVPKPYQIVIEGVRGASYVSDIAVDDVYLTENCKVYEENLMTESDWYSSSSTTEMFLNARSCENHCENDTFEASSSFAIDCSCTLSCLDTSSCCPDYATFCLYPDYTSPEDSTLTTTTTFSTTTTTSTTTKKPTAATTTTTAKPTTKTTTATAARTTSKRTAPPTTTVKRTTTVRTTTTVAARTTFKRRTLPSTATTVRKTKPITKSLTKPTKRTTLTTTSSTIEGVDFATVPYDPRFNDDEEANINETVLSKISVDTDAAFGGLSTRTVGVIVGSVALLLATVVAVVCVVKRYYLICSPFNRINKSKSGMDSQSDVRFLTSDEILDFNLRKMDE